MVAKAPVPSKAALHALRGIVFTTSCTFALLTEERRRRTKLARTAIDNARKLHTTKARRGSLTGRDARQIDSELDMLTFPRSTEYPRRKRRQNSPKRTAPGAKSNSSRRAAKQNPSNIHPFDMMPIRNAASDGAEYSQRPSATDVSPTNATQHAKTNLASQKDHRATRQNRSAGLDRRRSAFDVHKEPIQWSGQATSRATSRITVVRQDFKNTTVSAAQPTAPATTEESLRQAVEKFIADPIVVSPSGVRVATVFPLLKRLFVSMESAERRRLMHYQDLIMSVFEKILPSNTKLEGSSVTRQLRQFGLKLLKSMIGSDVDRLRSCLKTLLALYNDLPQMLASLVQWLAEQSNVPAMRNLSKAVSDTVEQGISSNQNCFLEVLERHADRYKNISDTQRLFNMLLDARVFGDSELQMAEYYLHSALLNIAMDAGNEANACFERDELRRIDIDLANRDFRLESSTFLESVATDKFVSAQEILDRLDKFENKDAQKFQDLLIRTADTLVPKLKPMELEALLHQLVEKYKFKLTGRWVYPVIDHYSAHLDQKGMLAWLEFCVRNGYQIEDSFLQKFYVKYRLHWHASDQELTELYRRLRKISPQARRPRIVRPEVIYDKSSKSVTPTREREDWETMYIRSASKVKDPEKIPDQDLFKKMKTDAQDSKWDEVWTQFQSRALGSRFSLRCLRLAVLARIKLDSGASRTAKMLVSDAKAKGHDVTEVLTPLLLAELEEGKKPIDVLQDHCYHGLKINDMVYNLAAWNASTHGNHLEAIHICKTAALKNGNGDWLYNAFNFKNMLHAFTGMCQYDELMSLLSQFTAERRWWSESALCAKALKFSMKAVAMRAATAMQRHDALLHETMLYQLEKAFHFGGQWRLQCDERLDRIELGDTLVGMYDAEFSAQRPQPIANRVATTATSKEVSSGQRRPEHEPATDRIRVDAVTQTGRHSVSESLTDELVTIEDFSKLRWRTEQEPTRHHEENTGLGIRPSANNVLLKSTDTVLDWPLPQRKIMMPAKVVRHAMEQGLGA